MNDHEDNPTHRGDTTCASPRSPEVVRSVLVVVAHPDDETLWVGGTILMHPDWRWRVISLCRGNDPARRPRFFNALTSLGASGSMGELDDGPTQRPQSDRHVEDTVMGELLERSYDLIITHSPFGEYTRHLRHEETGRAVFHLWRSGALTAEALWLFAYSDNLRTRRPMAMADAHLRVTLSEDIWNRKQAIIHDVYGFGLDSWELGVTPEDEAFWCFDGPESVIAWQQRYPGQLTPATKGN